MQHTTLFFLLMVALFVPGFAQSTADQGQTCTFRYQVTAPSGLSLRSQPKLESPRLGAYPSGTVFSACRPSGLYSDTIEGVSGQWLETRYAGKTAYIFDGFLQPLGRLRFMEVALLVSDWDLKDLEGYWGFRKRNPAHRQPSQTFYEWVPFKPETYIDADKKYGWDSERFYQDQWIYLAKGLQLGKQKAFGIHFQGKRLYPGEEYRVGLKGGSYFFYALGKVEPLKQETDRMLKIRGYEVRMDHREKPLSRDDWGQYDGPPRKSLSVYQVKDSWFAEGFNAIPVNVDWVGDLDQDGKADMVIQTWFHHECWETRVYLSSYAEEGALLGLAYFGQGCS
ncbi:MAG: SH3 domain-containing protein [Bacteroidota bacterium]